MNNFFGGLAMEEDKKQEKKSKTEHRQDLIKEIILQGKTGSHGQMKNSLKSKDIEISQSTISRDFKKLGIVDGVNGIYELTDEDNRTSKSKIVAEVLEKNEATVYFPLSVFAIKTKAGFARATSQLIKEFYKEEIFGIISSEDTALILVEDVEDGGKANNLAILLKALQPKK